MLLTTHTHPSSAEVKKELSYTSTHPMGPPGPVTGFTLPLYHVNLFAEHNALADREMFSKTVSCIRILFGISTCVFFCVRLCFSMQNEDLQQGVDL
jgi:hypothetical protein